MRPDCVIPNVQLGCFACPATKLCDRQQLLLMCEYQNCECRARGELTVSPGAC